MKATYPEGTTERILELRRTGMIRIKIAEEVGVDINKVHSDLQRFRDQWTPRTKEENSQLHTKYPDGTKDVILELRRQGVKTKDIEFQTKVDQSTIKYWCFEAGIVLTSKQRGNNKRIHDDAKVQEVLDLRKSGISREQVSIEAGVPLSFVKRSQSKTDLTLPMEVRTKNSQEGKQKYYDEVKEEFLSLVKEKGGKVLSEYENTRTILKISCSIGHEFEAKPNWVLMGTWCQSCFFDTMTGTESPRSQQMLERRGYKTHLDWYNDLAETKGGKCLSTEATVSHIPLRWECKKKHVWTAKPNTIANGHWCPSCANVGPSKPQLEISAYIKSVIQDEVLDSTRTVISPKELDIYVPSKKFAFEFNGLRWHSSIMDGWKSGKEAHKAAECHKLGLKFLMVFEDEWRDKPELIKAMIRYRLGVFSGLKLHARKLELKLLQKNVEWKAFFDRNHLDSSVNASWGYGLFSGDRLVMCATVRTNHRGESEIARLATDYDFSVAGGAGRLVSAIRKKLEGAPLITFSNNRLSSGATYAALGAVDITETTRPSYYYTDGKTRVWRFRCKRVNDSEVLARFPDVPHTEKDQALAGVFSESIFGDRRPLYRIEDCGHRKWRF